MGEEKPKDLLDRIMSLVSAAIGSSEVFAGATMMAKGVTEEDDVIEAIYPLFENIGDLLRNLPAKELADLIDVFTKDKELFYDGIKSVRETLPIIAFVLEIFGMVSPIIVKLTDNDNVKKGLATIISGMVPVFGALPAIILKTTPLIAKMGGEAEEIKEVIKPVLSHLTALIIEIREILEDQLQMLTAAL